MTPRRRGSLPAAAAGILAAGLLLAPGCSTAPPSSPAEVRAMRAPLIPPGPGDAAWRKAPLHAAPLILQDLVEPRLLEVSTKEVRVQSMTDGGRIAFRLEWDDGSRDDAPRAERFGDACALQLPSVLTADLPAPQMGEAGRSVEITYWRAAWQATVDGRADSIRELFPNAAVDHYPFEAASLPPDSKEARAMQDRYAPARALGNPMAGPRATPVQDLVAEGPGTLKPAQRQTSQGSGAHGATGWAVVLVRPLPEALSSGGRSQVAFAVWEGGHQEAGSRKMRTGWIPLAVEGRP